MEIGFCRENCISIVLYICFSSHPPTAAFSRLPALKGKLQLRLKPASLHFWAECAGGRVLSKDAGLQQALDRPVEAFRLVILPVELQVPYRVKGIQYLRPIVSCFVTHILQVGDFHVP